MPCLPAITWKHPTEPSGKQWSTIAAIETVRPQTTLARTANLLLKDVRLPEQGMIPTCTVCVSFQ